MSLSKKIRRNQIVNGNINAHKKALELAAICLNYNSIFLELARKLDTKMSLEVFKEYSKNFETLMATYDEYESYVHNDDNYVELGKADFKFAKEVEEFIDVIMQGTVNYLKELDGQNEYQEDISKCLKALHLDEESFALLTHGLADECHELLDSVNEINNLNKKLLLYFDKKTNTLNDDGLSFIKETNYLEKVSNLIKQEEENLEIIRQHVKKMDGCLLPKGKERDLLGLARKLAHEDSDKQLDFNKRMVKIVEENI